MPEHQSSAQSGPSILASFLTVRPRKKESRLYKAALLDWMCCAFAGRLEPASHSALRARPGAPELGLFLATAGHVLDFDDTYAPGLVHLSAATAPAAIIAGAGVGATVERVLDAFASGFEAMAAVSRACYPTLYDRGWHATAVCGVVGAAVASAALLELDDDRTRHAVALGLLASGGLRAAFGSDGKSLQVGMAVSQGLTAARLAGAGARASDRVLVGPGGFEDVYGGAWPSEPADVEAVRDNWIKAYPCCLQTHAPIEAALEARNRGASDAGRAVVTVHPVSRQAAALDDVNTGMEAKFSIPYLTALTVLGGPPRLDDFRAVDEAARSLGRRVEVRTDASMAESEARLDWFEDGGHEQFQVPVALGSPARPLSDVQREEKARSLGAGHLLDALDDGARPIEEVLEILAPRACDLVEPPTHR